MTVTITGVLLAASVLVVALAAVSITSTNSRLGHAAATLIDSEVAQTQGRTWPMRFVRWGGFAIGLAVVVLLAVCMPAISSWLISQLPHS